VGHQVVTLVEQLEARTGVEVGLVGADRKPHEQVAERPDRSEHQRQCGVRERRELGVCLFGVREEAAQQLQQDLVADVEEIAANRT